MKLFPHLGRLLTMLALVGLVVGAAIPAMAGPIGGAVPTMAMPDGMPPCQDTHPDCRDMVGSCPFQIACAAKAPLATLAAEAILLPPIANGVETFRDCRAAYSWLIAPLARPPKA